MSLAIPDLTNFKEFFKKNEFSGGIDLVAALVLETTIPPFLFLLY